MANGDPITFPELKDPASFYSNPQPAKRKPVSGLDAIVSQFSQIEDPLTRSLAKGLVESEISNTLGFRFTIPDPEDLEMIAKQKRIDIAAMDRQIAMDTIEQAKSIFLDHPEQHAAWGLKGQDIDTLLESNPDLFVAAAQKAGLTDMTRGLLSRGKVKDTDTASAGPAFQQEQAKKQVDVLQTQASGLKAAEDVVKGGESQTAAAKAALKTSFEALGADTDFFDSDFDTERGGVALADATDTLLRSAGPAFQRMAAEGMLAAVKDDVVDFLEDADAVNGQVIVNDRPTFYTAVSLMRMAKARGVTDGDQLKEIGLGAFVGFEGRSFNDFLAKEAKTSGADPVTFAATLGL